MCGLSCGYMGKLIGLVWEGIGIIWAASSLHIADTPTIILHILHPIDNIIHVTILESSLIQSSCYLNHAGP